MVINRAQREVSCGHCDKSARRAGRAAMETHPLDELLRVLLLLRRYTTILELGDEAVERRAKTREGVWRESSW